ncbi:MAG: hypothetical protein ACTSUF_04770 [Candidatus Heimdallarchaeaceae archaeon]
MKEAIRFKHYLGYGRTRSILKNNNRAKIIFLILNIIQWFFYIIISLSWSYLNIYFFLLTSTKLVVIYSLIMFPLVIFVDDKGVIPLWNTREHRKDIIEEKILFNLVNALKFFLFNLGIILILKFSGLIEKWDKTNPNITVSFYTPNALEAILIGLLVILCFFSIIIINYWFSLRFIKIEGFVEETQLLKLNRKKIIIGTVPFLCLFWAILWGLLDQGFMLSKLNRNFEGAEKMLGFIVEANFWVLIWEISILIIIFITLIADIKRMNKLDIQIATKNNFPNKKMIYNT